MKSSPILIYASLALDTSTVSIKGISTAWKRCVAILKTGGAPPSAEWIPSEPPSFSRRTGRMKPTRSRNRITSFPPPRPSGAAQILESGLKVKVGTAQSATTAEHMGKCQVKPDLRRAGSKPLDLTLSGRNILHDRKLLIVEPWACTGQSDMEFKPAEAIDGPLEDTPCPGELIHRQTVQWSGSSGIAVPVR